MKEKRMKQMGKRLLFFIGCILCFVSFEKGPVFAKEATVTASEHDTKVIPDLYNTGAVAPEEGFTVISDDKIPCTINGEKTTLQGAVADDTFKINLKYKNADLNGKIVIENVDLSKYKFVVYSPDALKEGGRKLSFVFKNCKLKSFGGERKSFDEISYEFNDCSFLSASGSDITFNRCRFGGGIKDRLNLFVNCHVNDCYIYNPTSETAADGEIHVDGIQIYGNNSDSTVKTENIHFDNCRFEMPALRYPNASKTYVNACIMLQTEFSDGDNMSFKNCYINGGGYSVYAHGVKGTKLSNITFQNLHFGCTALYGRLYPDKPAQDQVAWNEDTWDDASSIYVGTVKRDQGKNETTLCVSNDTNQKRYFRAYTSNGHFYDYSIDACPTYKEFNGSGMVFEEFPFDRIYTIPEYCEWVVVYEMLPTDNSAAATMKQVRFRNWTDEKSVKIADVSAANLAYALSEDGTLTISGFGNMPEFSSVEKIPWYSDRDKIKKVVITGVTSVSNNAFSDCVNLEEVVFPEKFEKVGDSAFSGCIKLPEINLNQAKELKSIGEKAFFNCISLRKVTFPESIVSVGENAFSVDADTYQQIRERTDVYYDGSIEKWLKISFGDSTSTKLSDAASNPMYLSGGNLYVNGSKLVTELNMQGSSSTVIGRNVFAGCLSLTKVNLTGVTDIGTNAFAKSKVGGTIVIPATVKSFGTYAFCECSSLEKLIWESSVSVAMGAFQSDISLKEIVISGDATGVGNWAFKDCSGLEKVTLPKTMEKLLQSSFQNCVSLKDINIPEGVTGMGNYVFSGCTSLGSISFMGKACPAMGINPFTYIPDASVLVYIPENATGYAENDALVKIASHLFSTKVIVSDCALPGTEQYTCLLHKNCAADHCEEIAQARDHQPGKAVSENVVPATYEQEGSYEEVCYCSVCKKELSREKKTIAKLTKEDIIISNGGGGGLSVTDQEQDTNQENTSGETTENTSGQTTQNVSGNSIKKVTVKNTALKKVVNKKTKKIEVTWKKIKGATGYEVQYSTNKNFKKGVRTKKVKGASKVKVKVTVKNSKAKKKYYVRVRAYKVVDGKKYVSKWSKKKSVTL